MAAPQLGNDVPIREFLNALASADSTHGAVSASAVAGAMGTSLLLMVAALPTTRSDSIDERTALMHAGIALGELQEQLIETIETETAVKLFAARNMPQASQAQRSKREARDTARLARRGRRSAGSHTSVCTRVNARADGCGIQLSCCRKRGGAGRRAAPRRLDRRAVQSGSKTEQPDRRGVHEGGRRRNCASQRGGG